MSSRRAILKLIGSMPLAGNIATRTLAEQIASPAVMTALAAAGTAATQLPGMPKSLAQTAFGDAIGGQLNQLLGRTEQEFQALYQMRTDGFDPDISALKSCSRSYKVMKQFERDSERADFLGSARRLIWGYP